MSLSKIFFEEGKSIAMTLFVILPFKFDFIILFFVCCIVNTFVCICVYFYAREDI